MIYFITIIHMYPIIISILNFIDSPSIAYQYICKFTNNTNNNT